APPGGRGGGPAGTGWQARRDPPGGRAALAILRGRQCPRIATEASRPEAQPPRPPATASARAVGRSSLPRAPRSHTAGGGGRRRRRRRRRGGGRLITGGGGRRAGGARG